MILHLTQKKDFAIVIRLMTLRWVDCPGLSGWTLSAITYIYRRGWRWEIWRGRGDGMWLWKQRLEPQTMEFWQLPEAGKSKAQIIPITTRSMALMTPWFWPSETDFRLLASRTVKQQIWFVCFLKPLLAMFVTAAPVNEHKNCHPSPKEEILKMLLNTWSLWF